MSRLPLCLLAMAALLVSSCGKSEPGPGTGAATGNAGKLEDLTAEPRPELLSRPEPAYPAAAEKAHAQGNVRVEVTVDTTGAVIAAEVVESSGNDDLDEAALKAAFKATFRPALRDGVPVESRAIVPFGFWLGS